MKNLTKIILIALSLTLMSNACEPDWTDETTIEEEFNDKLRGSYHVSFHLDTTNMDSNNEMGNAFALAMMKMFQFNVTFKDNSKAVFEGFGKKNTIGWKMEGNRLSFINDKNKEDSKAPESFLIKRFNGNFDKFIMVIDESDSSSIAKSVIFEKLGVE